MEDFKTRQNMYFERLRQNPEFLKKIIEGSKDKKSLEVILVPKDEKELSVAESMFTVMTDMVSIVEKAYYDELNKIDVDNSYVVNLFVDIINALMSNDENKINEMKEYIKHTISIEDSARMIYEMLVVFAQDPEKAVESIMAKCGFDIDDELSLAQFQMYLNKANEITNTSNDNLNLENVNIEDEKNVEGTVNFAKEFHRLYEEGLKKNPTMTLE